MFSLKRSAAEAFVAPFRVSSQENVTRDNVFFLEFVSFPCEKRFKPHIQIKILVPLRGSVQNFQRASPSRLFYMGAPTLGWEGSQKTTLTPWESVASDL